MTNKTTDPYKISPQKLVDFIRNAATAVADGKVSGFSADERVSVSGQLNTAADELAVSVAEHHRLEKAKTAAGKFSRKKQRGGQHAIAILKLLLRAKGAGTNEYKAVGLKPPAKRRKIVEPRTPARLGAFAESNGTNLLTFRGNNKPGSVTYVVEARSSVDAPYVIIGTTTTQSFRHQDVRLGDFYQYRVRAQATRRRTSGYSNEAVVCPS